MTFKAAENFSWMLPYEGIFIVNDTPISEEFEKPRDSNLNLMQKCEIISNI
jgi:hypothetical protein